MLIQLIFALLVAALLLSLPTLTVAIVARIYKIGDRFIPAALWIIIEASGTLAFVVLLYVARPHWFADNPITTSVLPAAAIMYLAFNVLGIGLVHFDTRDRQPAQIRTE